MVQQQTLGTATEEGKEEERARRERLRQDRKGEGPRNKHQHFEPDGPDATGEALPIIFSPKFEMFSTGDAPLWGSLQ